jgi:hypothetical protein
MQDPSAAMFHIHQHVARQPGQQGELLLSESAFNAQTLNPSTQRPPPTLPRGNALGVVLTGACRHAFQYSRQKAQSLLY